MVTGSRAEYGLLYWLMKEIQGDPELKLQIIATGTHLSPEFGLTYKEIESDGFVIDEKLEIVLSSDSASGVTKSLGLAEIGFADALQRLQPDIIVILGDRYEALAAAQAAMLANIPVAHISGGESTEGVVDEAIRHSITKMAQLHFVAAELYRKRVVQMGENPDRVFNYGHLGLDNIRRLPLLSLRELEQQLGFLLGEDFFLVTYHPVTLERGEAGTDAEELLAALDHFPQTRLLLTGSNADAGGRAISRVMASYAEASKSRALFVNNLGRLKYLSAMRHCRLVIGNSSSGIIEAPALGKATVNIGERQQGRLKAKSIIDCGGKQVEIIVAIEGALGAEFQKGLVGVVSQYGQSDTSRKIRDQLKRTNLAGILKKRFYDINFKV